MTDIKHKRKPPNNIMVIKTKKENRRCKICNGILSIYNLEDECFHHKLNIDRDPDKHEKSFEYGLRNILNRLR